MPTFILLLSLASLCLIFHSCIGNPSHRLPGKRNEAEKYGISCPHPPFFAFFSQQKLILTHNPLQNNYFSTVTSWTDQTLKQNLTHVLPWWWWWWFCWLFSRPTGLHAPNSVSLRLVAESSERRLVTSWLADWMAPSIRWASCLLSSIIFRILPWEANPHRVAWCQGLCQGVEQATGPWSPFIPPRLPQFRPCIQNTRWRRGKKTQVWLPSSLSQQKRPNHCLSSVSVWKTAERVVD